MNRKQKCVLRSSLRCSLGVQGTLLYWQTCSGFAIFTCRDKCWIFKPGSSSFFFGWRLQCTSWEPTEHFRVTLLSPVLFGPSETKSGRPYGVMYVSSFSSCRSREHCSFGCGSTYKIRSKPDLSHFDVHGGLGKGTNIAHCSLFYASLGLYHLCFMPCTTHGAKHSSF